MAETVRVTRRVSDRVRFPGRAAGAETDIRTQVTLALPEFAPWELRFDFIVYGDDEDEQERIVKLAGFALDRRITLTNAEAALAADDDSLFMTPELVDRFNLYFWSYKRVAELRLLFSDEAWSHRAQVLDVIRGRTRPYRNHVLLVEEYRSRAGSKARIHDMAEALGCSRKTVWAELRKAFDAGLIREDELDLRPRAL